jgi:hypothetical protein
VLGAWPPFIETLRQWVRAEAGAGRLRNARSS